MTSTGLTPVSVPPVVREGASFSAMPVSFSGRDSSPLRGSGRVRWYLLIAAAVVVAFTLGAFVMRWIWMGPSSPETPGKSSASSSRSGAGGAAKTAGEASAAPPAKAGQAKAGAGGAAGAPTGTGRLVPAALPGVVPPSSPIGAPPVAKVAVPTGSLLAGIGSPQTPGPRLAPRSDAPAASTAAVSTGLDATTVQRTVRRYSPAVRQNCWQRALSARAPGVPTSAKVNATITIDPAGHVQAVTVAGAPRGYPTLARCIEGSVKGWQFPRAASQTVTNVPFMFVGQ